MAPASSKFTRYSCRPKAEVRKTTILEGSQQLPQLGRGLMLRTSLNLVAVIVLLGSPLPLLSQTAIEPPRLNDDRLQITLYASDPDVVTPIGATVDAQGRLYVIESHTHNPPQDYDGPKGDVIKVFSGEREDGRFEKMSVFADGLFQAQALAFHPNGTLYVVCTREVVILHDADGDLRSEARTRILNLDPYAKRANPHGQMQGIAFSHDGWLYVGAGTTEDDWISSDGKRLGVGPYWGGIIVRCRPDGTDLERFAWGFWNPYAMTFDHCGRLLAIDNDPDHRGPNRLLHIVRGGDYGYKRAYGRYGTHPYQAWEGELPGTLPMIAGIGEAPTALLNANDAALPPDYAETIIGASWGEHNLTLFHTQPTGASLTATSEVLLEGKGHDDQTSPFRPSGMAASPTDGAIYICDWMLIDYTTHSRGRIWKLSARSGVTTNRPRKRNAKTTDVPEFDRLTRLTEASEREEYPQLRQAAVNDDPFVRSAALAAMARPVFRNRVVEDLQHGNAGIRLGALLALRRANVGDAQSDIELAITDDDPNVVRMAMTWAGEKKLESLTDRIDQLASRPGLTADFFRTWLATMQIMEHLKTSDQQTGPRSEYKLNRQLSPEFVEQLAHDEARPPVLRAMALRWLRRIDTPRNHKLLRELARAKGSPLQVEAIRRLGHSPANDAKAVLSRIAIDSTQTTTVRAEAIAAMSGKPTLALVPLLSDSEPEVQIEAARSLRRLAENPAVRDAAKKTLASLHGEDQAAGLRSQLEFLLAPENALQARPDSLSGWQKLLSDGGSPDAGRRVFFSANSACSSCHPAEGRGIRPGTGSASGFVAMPLGPDLSVIARSADRDALIQSIIRPSDFIAPEYQGWFVELKNGQVTTGRQIDQASRSIQLITLDGQETDFPRKNIESWGAMTQSLMPENQHQSMSVQELRDLIAYLCSLN